MHTRMTSDDLIGVWSADVMYGPGAQSDEVLVFKPDGTGHMEVINPVTTSAELFRWTLEGSDGLRLTGEKGFYLGEGEPLRVEEHPSDLEGVFPLRIQVESVWAGRSMRVLRFVKSPWSGISDHFGFCRKTTHGCERPDFSWIERWSDHSGHGGEEVDK